MLKKITFFLSFLVLSSIYAQAQHDYKIYEWEKYHRGWMEVGLRASRIFNNSNTYQFYFDGRNRVKQGLSMTTANIAYGFSDKLMVGLNSDFLVKGSIGANFYRLRANALYRLSDKHSHSLGTSLFLEYSIPNSLSKLPTEIELKLILSKQWGDFQLDINPSLVQALSGSEADRQSALANCNVGFYWKRHYVFQPGLEYYGAFGEVTNLSSQKEQIHELFAVANIRLADGLLFNIGAGHGLTDASETVVGKIGIRYQFPTISPRKQHW
ncbi:MAG TPA: hypothetical protein VKA27_02265 [Sunxiuqinia sp.]|nr:hypothetical protein [Sunxiuqinia sp.]